MVISAALVFWFFGVNAFLMLFIKKEVVGNFKRDVDLHLRLYDKGYISKLPSYIKIISVKSYTKNKGYVFYGLWGKKFVLVNIAGVKRKLIEFSLALFLWELLLAILIIFIVYVSLKRIFKRQKYTDQFLKFILVAISHKLGNFLSAQKVNLELANIDEESKKRLSFALNEMEKDFRVVSSTIRSITSDNGRLSFVNVIEELRKVLDGFSFKNKKLDLQLYLDGYLAYVNPTDLRIVLSELATNAFKYSFSNISVIAEKYKKGVKIVFINDVKSISKGSGVGLSVIEFLCKKNNWIVTKKASGNLFEITFALMPK